MGNNLYSNLVNFYNVNDESFKEFMAEIYKQMLTTHRDVQYVKEHLTEEIEKILDKYLVDGNFNINIEEKVNEFLENNQEIKNINSQMEIIKNYIYVEDFGAKGDGVTDDSLAFQNAIDYASVNNKTICLLNKTYALSHFTLKNNMSIISNEYAVLKILESSYSSFINIDNGPITNLIYNATLKNVFISCNEYNTNQVIINCTAKNQDSYGGGIWHYTFENVRIQTLNGKQIGVLLNADDSIQGVDVANQYIQFKNVNIYKNSENSYCIKIEGQLGQTKFDTCEFNGVSNSVKGWLMKFESITSNDNTFMPVSFDNCTFQSCDKGIYAIDAHAIFNNCHVEGVTNQFIQAKGELAHISFNNSNISGGVKPFRIEGSGTISGNDNTWNAPSGVACALEGNAIGTYLFDLDLYMKDMYICRENPYYSHSGITLNVGYSKSVFLNTTINDIQIIKGMFKNGDILTITNVADTNVNIENKSFTTNSNLIWNGVNVITLKKNQTVKFVNLGENFYLVDLQRDVQNDLQIKSKDLTLSFTTGVMTTEVATGVNIDNILGFYMIYNDNVFSNPPVISLKTNGDIIGVAKNNPQSDFSVTIKLKYLG